MTNTERLADIRQGYEEARALAGEGASTAWPAQAAAYQRRFAKQCLVDVPYLLAEVERLTAERDGERAKLEAAVVQAALAERRAILAYDAMAASVWPSQYVTETTRAVYASRKAYEAAVDALLAFLGKGTDAD